MNKQQLANKIWESANKMRSKIEANEYKDYILGFIFYKFLSDTEIRYLKSIGCDDDNMNLVTEDEPDFVENVQKNIGYFISYENLFSTWLAMGSDFNVSNVRDALSAFNRLINASYKKVFDKIFDTLQTGLSKLGDSSGTQTKAITDLIHLIKDIPMDGRQDYDVLGFIYEYLISNFAANAGKKAGEFYTPHEVSLLMSEIVANHLKDRTEIKIYDPTSGSGSLLINIGKSAARYIENDNGIKYYAQELKENTYNLTRMNLIMRGILPSNIETRNADTLEDDWPYFDESDPVGTYEPLHVDAVVSNPPYSQNWDPSDKENDPRYKRYGVAPKGKADYAFLLHDLYHVKSNGIMTIVLPHGVLFRGGEEGKIRRNLIEHNNIDAIIGLPANIFFGTGIPTIIIVLKQKRADTDVLIIDASKGYEKVGKNNKLRSSDIKRIVDAVAARKTIPKFSILVSREKIRENEYNLNIPRYVDSSEKAESWDIYASMFGGVPAGEVNELDKYWKAFPDLQASLFADAGSEYLHFCVDNIKNTVTEHRNIRSFNECFVNAFSGFESVLYDELLKDVLNVNISQEENAIAEQVFERLANIPLVDKYEAYQILDDEWTKITVDLEIIQTEGFEAVKKVDPNMIIKKKDNKDIEVQDGWKGRILPFELVQSFKLPDAVISLRRKEDRLAEIASEYNELIDALPEDDKERLLNDSNDSFVPREIVAALNEIYSTVSSPDADILTEYLSLNKKDDKLAFINAHESLFDDSMQKGKNGIYSQKTVEQRILSFKTQVKFENDSYEYVVVKANALMNEEKDLKKLIKDEALKLQHDTKAAIENLTDSEAYELLRRKWIVPIVTALKKLPENILSVFIGELEMLSKKYETTFYDVEQQIDATQESFVGLIDQLTGTEYDMKGLEELKKLLGGEK